MAETEYMLGLADASDRVAGVVGWVDFERPAHRDVLARLAAHPKLKGIRPMIQDIADVDWMLRDDVQWGFSALCDLGVRLDALGFPRHLANFEIILKRYPNLPVVIDHCMKPRIADHTPALFDDWADGMSRLAVTGAYCELSGLVTEAAPGAGVSELQPYADHVLKAFGPERVMWGSDWPVCRVRHEYQDWFSMARAMTDNLSDTHRDRVFGETAIDFYGLSV